MRKPLLLRGRVAGGVVRSGQRGGDRSWLLAVIFLALFACMVLTEVFYVDDQQRRQAAQLDDKFSGLFAGEEGRYAAVDPSKASRVARELARARDEDPPLDSQQTNGGSLADGGDFWQPVANSKDKFFVYSAYHDDRRTRWVRVIAAARTRLADKVVCVLEFADGRDPLTVPALNRLIRENWNLKYSAYFVLCPLKQPNIAVPTYVSVVKQGDSGEAGNRLRVHNNRKQHEGSAKGAAVCIKPLHYEYNKVSNLVEFVELNRLLGVQHFVLYNHTVGPDVACILQKYVEEGVVSVLPWQLGMASQKEIRTEGLFAALNDCLYRTMHRFRLVLMIDLDEYILPHRNRTLTLLLDHLLKKNPERTGAFSFQNSFFYLQWPDDSSSKDLPYKLLTLQKTIRKSKFHAHKQRSKCVVVPDRVVEMGNHFVWEFIPGRTMVNVPPDMGFLHHYRVCEFGGNDCVNTTHVVDRRAYEWKDDLVQAVAQRLRSLQPVCGNNIARFLTH